MTFFTTDCANQWDQMTRLPFQFLTNENLPNKEKNFAKVLQNTKRTLYNFQIRLKLCQIWSLWCQLETHTIETAAYDKPVSMSRWTQRELTHKWFSNQITWWFCYLRLSSWYLCKEALLKIGHPRTLFSFFRLFQTNITNFTTNKCEKMSIQYMAPRFKPTTFGTWVSSHNQ